MTTGSVGAGEQERRWAAGRTRWWNSTGGGSYSAAGAGAGGGGGKGVLQKGNVKKGDGGRKFREEWPELDKENWKWMKENGIDIATGNVAVKGVEGGDAIRDCVGGGIVGLRRPSGSQAVVGAVVEGGREGGGWLGRHKLWVAGAVIFTYVLVARLLGDGA